MQNSSRADCSHGTPRFAEFSGSTALPEDGKRVEKKKAIRLQVLPLSARSWTSPAIPWQDDKALPSFESLRLQTPGSLLRVPVASPKSSNRPGEKHWKELLFYREPPHLAWQFFVESWKYPSSGAMLSPATRKRVLREAALQLQLVRHFENHDDP